MGSRSIFRGPRWLRGALMGSERVIRYVKWLPWGHGVGLMGFLMNHEAYMPVDKWSRVWSQTTEQPSDPRAGLTWWEKNLTSIRLMQKLHNWYHAASINSKCLIMFPFFLLVLSDIAWKCTHMHVHKGTDEHIVQWLCTCKHYDPITLPLPPENLGWEIEAVSWTHDFAATWFSMVTIQQVKGRGVFMNHTSIFLCTCLGLV